MGILTGLFKLRDKIVLMVAATVFYLVVTLLGKLVNERSAMEMTAVYACVASVRLHRLWSN